VNLTIRGSQVNWAPGRHVVDKKSGAPKLVHCLTILLKANSHKDVPRRRADSFGVMLFPICINKDDVKVCHSLKILSL
jgi:hypothetical protein